MLKGANEAAVKEVKDALVAAYPVHRSEFEIQSWLFAQLRSAGYDARGEVTVPHGVSGRSSRLDIVVYENKIPIRVIECKAEHSAHDNRDYWKYGWIVGIPVDVVFGGEHQQYMEWVLEHMHDAIDWRAPVVDRTWAATVERVPITIEEIESQAPYTRETLSRWGLKSPLKKGWKQRLIQTGVPRRTPSG